MRFVLSKHSLIMPVISRPAATRDARRGGQSDESLQISIQRRAREHRAAPRPGTHLCAALLCRGGREGGAPRTTEPLHGTHPHTPLPTHPHTHSLTWSLPPSVPC